MQTEKYGRIEKDGELKATLPPQVPDKVRDKVVHFAPIPAFDQITQGVFQTEAVDKGDLIEVGVAVVDLDIDEQQDEQFEAYEFETVPQSKG